MRAALRGGQHVTLVLDRAGAQLAFISNRDALAEQAAAKKAVKKDDKTPEVPAAYQVFFWRAKDAAAAMKITAQDLKKLGVVDEIIPEPKGGAHRAAKDAISATGEAIARALRTFDGVPADALRTQRREKFLGIGRNL